MSTRGCPFRCDFCHKSVFGDLFSARPVESVVDEMREIAELGYDHIWMSDDLFTLNYKRTFELAKAIEDAHLPLTWECLSRVTHVDQQLFEQMLRAAILKGAIQHRLIRMHMRPAARAFQFATDPMLRALK